MTATITAQTSRQAATVPVVLAISSVCAQSQTAGGAIFQDGITAVSKPVHTWDLFISEHGVHRQESNLSVCLREADKTKGAIEGQSHGVDASRIGNRVANESGQLLFGDVPAGDCTLLAIRGAKILALRTVQVRAKSRVVVDVSPHLPVTTTLHLSED
jgi:hypothetical protein